MSVLIGGGSGFIGRHLTHLLKHQGRKVIHISRKAGAGRVTWDDLSSGGLPEDCEAVVNLAGENVLNPLKRWNEGFKQEVYSSRINTTKSLAKIIARSEQKPKVFVTTSAIGFYPPSPTAEYTEDSAAGQDFFSTLCQDVEAASELPADSGVRQAIIRVGIALGRDGGAIQQMFWPFFFGTGGRIGSGTQWFPWVHVDDVAGIYTHAVEHENVSGVLNAVAPEAVNNSEFTSAFAKAMSRPALFPVPSFSLNMVFGSERAKILLDGQKVVPKRTLESGYEFLYPDIDSACKDCSRLIYSV